MNPSPLRYPGGKYKLYKYVDVPKIVEFTNFLHSEKHYINKYTDFKELIKELYRRC